MNRQRIFVILAAALLYKQCMDGYGSSSFFLLLLATATHSSEGNIMLNVLLQFCMPLLQQSSQIYFGSTLSNYLQRWVLEFHTLRLHIEPER